MALIAVLALLFQSQVLPPPFPRDGAMKLFENDRVVVWDVAWLKQAYPVHRHVYDYAGIYYTNGDRIVVSEQGRRSPTSSVAWDTFFFSAWRHTQRRRGQRRSASSRVCRIQGS
jgi:hypothetical protein